MDAWSLAVASGGCSFAGSPGARSVNLEVDAGTPRPDARPPLKNEFNASHIPVTFWEMQTGDLVITEDVQIHTDPYRATLTHTEPHRPPDDRRRRNYPRALGLCLYSCVTGGFSPRA